jgi:hypothetical protein
MNNNANEINNGEKTKKCSKCGETKSISLFHKHKKGKYGVEDKCKLCRKEYDFKYYETHSDYHKEKSTQWGLDNPERKKEHLKKHLKTDRYRETWNKYYEENKEKLISATKEWNENNRDRVNARDREKYKNNIQFKLRKVLRSRLLCALNGKMKAQSTFDLLGCSIDDFKTHIENQLLPEMLWINFGEIWEIDHIIPCDSFDLTIKEEQQKCFHYSNMQPLFKTTEIAEQFGYDKHIGNRNKGYKIN